LTKSLRNSGAERSELRALPGASAKRRDCAGDLAERRFDYFFVATPVLSGRPENSADKDGGSYIGLDLRPWRFCATLRGFFPRKNSPVWLLQSSRPVAGSIVAEGDTIDVDLLDAEAGKQVVLADVLMHADGEKVTSRRTDRRRKSHRGSGGATQR
jgi:ribosomal protein L21